jgi:hypothetical protein
VKRRPGSPLRGIPRPDRLPSLRPDDTDPNRAPDAHHRRHPPGPGLVRPWGEVVPRWVPLVGGRVIPVRVAVAAASTGAACIFAVYGYAVANGIFEFRAAPDIPGCPAPLDAPGAWLAIVSYAPLLAWGPLLVVVTVAYHRRRTRAVAA